MTDLAALELERRIHDARLLREHYLRDPHRPGYHFVVPEGVHGPVDPNGTLFWKGRYHLFYIYQHEGKHCWGHVSSIDLVHWRHHVPGLLPGGADDGIFSGGVFVDHNGVPTITYWGLGKPGGVCLATATDDHLDHWTKHPANPVIRETAPGLTVTPSADGTGNELVYGAADPSAIWSHNGRYYMLTGNLLVLWEYGEKRKQPEHLGDTLYLFVSDDLEHWTYLHRFYTSSRQWTREFEDCMCPDFFPLPTSPDGGTPSETYMNLFISHRLGCQYYLGRYANDRFEPQQHGRMTWVDNEYFAPESLLDAAGRRIMWTWVFDRREHATKLTSGWSGELSLPRVLWLGNDNTLRMAPPPELAALRYNPRRAENLHIHANDERPLCDGQGNAIQGDSLELAVTFAPASAGTFGLKVCCSPDGQEQTVISYDATNHTLNVDTRHASLGEGTKVVESAPLKLPAGESLSLRVFLDKSFVEVFANTRQAICRRIYPTRRDSLEVRLFSDVDISIPRVDAWEMMPSNPY
ncbi:MAG: glycoside hydrolase family 32 protein [Phycisphaerae bacterium]|nr:glycoside hydrolase family 32 protein [Phycisphaerae bacterium]